MTDGVLRHGRRARASALLAVLGLAATVSAASAQVAVESIASREGTRSTARTGAPIYASPEIPPNPHAWPLPNNGLDWQNLSDPLGTPLPVIGLGQTFGPDGLTPATPPTGNYTVDRSGNEVYTDPANGTFSSFGSTEQQVK